MAVALYARVSTVEQAERDLSIPDQVKQIRKWCETNEHLIAKEYFEPGASARDDRRPVFQEMMADALTDPAPFEAIIVHSQSRFFRDGLEFGLKERTLQKHGVNLISITQPITDDPSGVLMRRLFANMDEYQSLENAKHTGRSMLENARQGYWNRNKALYEYQAVDAEAVGRKGRKKRKIVIHDDEAPIVRKMYDWYLNGVQGKDSGLKAIATKLNQSGQLMRGNLWRIQKVCQVLSDTIYKGEYIYNRTDSRTGKAKSKDQWVRMPVPAIIDGSIWERVDAPTSASGKDARAAAWVPAPVVRFINLRSLQQRNYCYNREKWQVSILHLYNKGRERR
ncbi:MAG: recombinase family protein [Rhodospirillaceae bacterium]